jgi:hypothetical protein
MFSNSSWWFGVAKGQRGVLELPRGYTTGTLCSYTQYFHNGDAQMVHCLVFGQ